MLTFDLFEFFRFLLTITATTYGIVRLIVIIWRWQGIAETATLGSGVLYRYFMVLALRARFRLFILDFLEIAGLGVLLAVLIGRHWE